ncbi:hypothetical protein Agub_g4993, partial [Astrephomene gubernaculifera]
SSGAVLLLEVACRHQQQLQAGAAHQVAVAGTGAAAAATAPGQGAAGPSVMVAGAGEPEPVGQLLRHGAAEAAWSAAVVAAARLPGEVFSSPLVLPAAAAAAEKEEEGGGPLGAHAGSQVPPFGATSISTSSATDGPLEQHPSRRPPRGAAVCVFVGCRDDCVYALEVRC